MFGASNLGMWFATGALMVVLAVGGKLALRRLASYEERLRTEIATEKDQCGLRCPVCKEIG
jgi:hypothetical protein